MKKAAILAVILLATSVVCFASSTPFCITISRPTLELGILNEKAKVLPMPQIDPRRALLVKKDIHIRVLIDLKSGGIVMAYPDRKLPKSIQQSVFYAAKDAKFDIAFEEFSIYQGAGTIIYKPGDLNAETIVNDTPSPLFTRMEDIQEFALSLPVPRPVEAGDSRFTGQVRVSVVIGAEDGRVAAVSAVYGLGILHGAGEQAAYQAKFPPLSTRSEGAPYVIGTLVYDVGGTGVGIAESADPESISPEMAVAYAEPIELPGVVAKPCGSA